MIPGNCVILFQSVKKDTRRTQIMHEVIVTIFYFYNECFEYEGSHEWYHSSISVTFFTKYHINIFCS